MVKVFLWVLAVVRPRSLAPLGARSSENMKRTSAFAVYVVVLSCMVLASAPGASALSGLPNPSEINTNNCPVNDPNKAAGAMNWVDCIPIQVCKLLGEVC